MDFPSLPNDKGTGRQQQKDPASKVTASHRRQPPAVTTTQRFKSPTSIGGVEALESKKPQTARLSAKPIPASADAGSEALRRVLTEKIEKARTTARISKNELKMQALDLEVRRGSSLSAGTAPLPLSMYATAHLPGIFLLLVLAILMLWFVFQQAG